MRALRFFMLSILPIALGIGALWSLANQLRKDPTATSRAAARAYQEQLHAAQSRDPKEQLTRLCNALSASFDLVRKDSRNTEALLLWSSTRQMLADYRCPRGRSEVSLDTVLRYAIRADPSNPEARFACGVIFDLNHEREEAFEQFSYFLNYSPRISDVQERYILSRLDSAAAVAKVVPARFPQIARWSRFFASWEAARYEQYQRAFSTLQNDAIEELSKRWQQGTISTPQFRTQILALAPLVQDEPVRRRCDRVLAETSEDLPTKKYLLDRSNLSAVRGVVGTIDRDAHPATSTLSHWNAYSLVSLDDGLRSVGIALSEKSLCLLELHFPGRHSLREIQSFIASLQLWGSNDNEFWEKLALAAPAASYTFSSETVIALDVPPGKYRYYKVHSTIGDHPRVFSEELARVLRVYAK